MLDNKIAIITGASSGIGRASAYALADAGFTAVLAGRRAELLAEVAGEIESAGGVAMPVTCDVRDEESVANLFSAVEERFGRVDLLFNNAGVNVAESEIGGFAKADWDEVMSTNVTGTFLCTRAAFGLMARQTPQGGRIINNGSIASHAPRPLSLAYTASKHAVTGITKQASLDGRKYNIACGQIDIGNATTAINVDQTEALQADGLKRPEPKMDVSNVAACVVSMASLPLDANVQFMTVIATAMPFIGRG